jgi:serine/threonine protein kinase
VHLTCPACQEAYELDVVAAGTVARARCLCGAVLDIARVVKDASLPRAFDKYTLIRHLASGGMGEIYLAKVDGVEGFERQLVIKRLLPHLSSDAQFIQMLVREAKLSVRLTHPNIVQVFDLAKTGSEYYIAMEYVPGANVQVIANRAKALGLRLPKEVCVHIVVQTLRGLSYAHRMPGPTGQTEPILHRDVTPHNVLVTQDGWAKLSDFGIAKARSEVSTTGPGVLKGKLGYFAPEQILGGVIDERADIYSTAIVLWELLAGRRLFKGETDAQALHAMAYPVVPALSLFRDDIPEGLEEALRRGLSADPEGRFLSAAEFADALTQALGTTGETSVTQSFFTQHPSLFASAEPGSDPLLGEVSVLPNDGALPSIMDLIGAPTTMHEVVAKRPPRWTLAALVLFCLVSAGAAGYFYVKASSPRPLPLDPSALGTERPLVAETAPPASAEVVADVPPGANESPALENRVKEELSSEKGVSPRAKTEKPTPLTAAEIQATVHAHSKHLLRCLQSEIDNTRIDARLTINRAGVVSAVKLSGARSAQTEPCLDKALKRVRMRRHSADSLEVIVPLKVERL